MCSSAAWPYNSVRHSAACSPRRARAAMMPTTMPMMPPVPMPLEPPPPPEDGAVLPAAAAEAGAGEASGGGAAGADAGLLGAGTWAGVVGAWAGGWAGGLAGLCGAGAWAAGLPGLEVCPRKTWLTFRPAQHHGRVWTLGTKGKSALLTLHQQITVVSCFADSAHDTWRSDT